MASGKEIRTKIKSVKSTQKITRAMEMVAASKMRKAQDRMQATRPYAQKMLKVIGHLAHSHPEYRPAFLQPREEVKAVGIITVSTDRGLCGGLNANVFRETLKAGSEWQNQKVDVKYCSIGNKASGFFKRTSGEVLAQQGNLGDTPHLADLFGTFKVMLDAFENGDIDKLYVIHNEFENTMTQKPKIMQLLPIEVDELDEELKHHWDYIYEPDAKEVLDRLLSRYIESLIFQGIVENIACEQAARMVAMKAASENAGTLIDELELAYNKARQAAITQELSEIVSGAAAV